MSKNKLIVASAGSGKTTMLVREALTITDKNVLITTYTEANGESIKQKIIKEKGYIPKNIIVQTWFSFLLTHGIRPFQGVMHEELWDKKIGFHLVSGKSGQKHDALGNLITTIKGIPLYWGETENFIKHYFTNSFKIHSDKVSKFVFKCNDLTKSTKQDVGLVIQRIAKLFPHIFIDEVQDLAGYDLEFLKLLFQSDSKILLVGDIRQATYSTNDSAKNKKYAKSKILNFFEDEDIKKQLEIDANLLTINYRCNTKICQFSNQLFLHYNQTNADCDADDTAHEGVFIIRPNEVELYLQKYPYCIQLRDSSKMQDIYANCGVMNFGEVKGLDFERVLIYPTKPMICRLKNNDSELAPTSRSKFYVALTRAKHSVCIVYDYKDEEQFNGIEKYIP